MSNVNRRSNQAHEPIAIVGIGCRYPGATNVSEFWRLLCDGVDAITEIPTDRFDVDAVYDSRPATPGKIASRLGGFIANFGKFDNFFFNLPPREAREMDRQHHQLLEVSYEALQDAGL